MSDNEESFERKWLALKSNINGLRVLDSNPKIEVYRIVEMMSQLEEYDKTGKCSHFYLTPAFAGREYKCIICLKQFELRDDQAVEELKQWLLGRENDIVLGDADLGELRGVFKAFFGREALEVN